MPSRPSLVLAAALASLALSASAAEAKPAYGVVPQDGALPEVADLELMPSAGIETIRLMLHWGTVERSPGFYDWSAADAMVRESVASGIEPFFFLYGSPEWAARADGHRCTADECSIYPPSTEPTRVEFAEYAAAAAGRYGPSGSFWAESPGLAYRPVRVWQIWNEQNSSKYFAPAVSVRDYAALLGDASRAIDAVDPGAEIVLGGMWGPDSARKVVVPAARYLRRLYRVRGVERHFDAIALHPYSGNLGGSLAQLEAAREAVEAAKDRSAGTWITELGWASGGPRGNPYVKGRAGQARMLSRVLGEFERRARSFRLRGVFWYSWRDKPGGDSICLWCGEAGLRAADGSAKPAWRAFARVARR